ncbi:MAG: pyroglutamyl-peptidase I [Firmicutes bacterium]|nr:pyroglutamyl-peptidase I [Bacillota bacterium]
MKRVLLTGFDPFGGESINPAWEVVKKISGEELEGITIQTKQLPTVFNEAIHEAILAIDKDRPDIIVALGQAGGRPDISVERVALNINDASLPDNKQQMPQDTLVVEGGPAAYFSTLPIRTMVEAMRDAGIPARISNTAGTFVCNHTMYGILHYISERQLPIRAGFIHIPYLPEQAVHHQGAPSMGLGDVTLALRVALLAACRLEECR